MKCIGFIFWLTVIYVTLSAQELVVSGSQESLINYSVEQVIQIPKGVTRLSVSVVIPQNFESKTYRLNIMDVNLTPHPSPSRLEEQTDRYGNQVRLYHWDQPESAIKFTTAIKADTRVNLQLLRSDAPFPVQSTPGQLEVFLESSPLVQSDDPTIQKRAKEVTAGSRYQFEAVQAVLHQVADHLHYVLIPEQYDALHAYRTGKGNCQNYSHLAAAFLRAVGIPVRIVNGITFKRSYSVPMETTEYSFEMAEGRHSWIEVYFPDAGWLPFDPQQTEFFVSNRYLRVEVGKDNEETIQDGLVRWSKLVGSGNDVPQLQEVIASTFVSDQNQLTSQGKVAGPRRLLLTPLVQYAAVVPPVIAAKPPEDKISPVTEKPKEARPPAGESPEIDYQKLRFETPFEYGNLEFPRKFDFVSAYLADQSKSAQEGELKRHFIVETAEYVTGQQQFAQVFELSEPVLLKKIGLALHCFGGEGYLWLELCEDENGNPGSPALASQKVAASTIRIPTGYDWVDFDFSREGAVLSPGKYWFILNYSGSPIINWFFSYGKPVGPVDGTRGRITGERHWNKVFSYELNYRVVGLAGKTR